MSATRSLRDALAKVTREAGALREERRRLGNLARAYLATRPGPGIDPGNVAGHFAASRRAQEIVDELVGVLSAQEPRS